MRHPKIQDPKDPSGRKINDLTRIIYNDQIRGYDYMLGSRSALAWLIESNRIKTDNKSGIISNPNDWADEHDDPRYIRDLVGRITTVSMRTLDIVESLPSLAL